MRVRLLLCCVLVAAAAPSASAIPIGDAPPSQLAARSASNPDLDVRHYDFDLTIDPDRRSISGGVTITAAALADVDEMEIDVADNLAVLAVRIDEQDLAFVRHHGYLTARFPATLGAGEEVRVLVIYHGYPEYLGDWGLTGLSFDLSETGEPWIYSLDEPDGAHSWVPVVEDARDKASWALDATVPTGLVVASNGVQPREPDDNGDGTTTYHWATAYSNSMYLFAINIGPFQYGEDTYQRLDGGQMPVVLYALPEHFDAAAHSPATTVPMIEFLADRFGEYPFADEKYGHVAVGFAGMEHATLTSLAWGYFSEPDSITILHELAHQWFGDYVTMKGWQHIWLNEGWATYCEALWREHLDPDSIHGYGAYFASNVLGSVIAEDPSTPFDDSTAIYDKGARVLHMLRRLVGDDAFFAATRSYLDQFGGGSATTEDFRAVFEAEYGHDLGWFFDQWIYQPGSPQLVTWHRYYSDGGSLRVAIYIKQVQPHYLYRLPIDVVLDGKRQRVWVDGDSDLTVIDLPVSASASVVTLDPDGDLLAAVSSLGESDLTDIPVVAAAVSRQSGVAPFDVTLTATSAQSLDGFRVEWSAATTGSPAVPLEGESATLHVAPEEVYWGYNSTYVYLELVPLSGGRGIWYPVPLRIYAYDPEDPDVAARMAGDLFGDGIVDGLDLAVVAARLGPVGWSGPYAGDVDNNGVVDDRDLAFVASRIGDVPASSRAGAR